MITKVIETLCLRENLSKSQTRELFEKIVHGELSDIELAAFLVALKAKGECADEIAGAAEALRHAAAPFPRPDGIVADSVGTGGDGKGTVNVSTAVAFIAAELGVKVAKIGNVSVSSKCGTADVLRAAGICIDAPSDVMRKCLDALNICFLFAPLYHAGVRHAMPIRKALATRTIFNMLGPLINPAHPSHQLTGVYDPKLCEIFAHTLQTLGCESALIVHGSGLDEIALHGPTNAALLQRGKIKSFTITPEDAGCKSYPIEALLGGGPEENAAWLKKLLQGKADAAHNEAVAINAGALLWICGKSADIKSGADLARHTIASGKAYERLMKFAEMSNGI